MNNSCPVCKNIECFQKGAIGSYSLLECSLCRLQFLSPVPDQHDIDKLYVKYYDKWDIKNSGNEVSLMKLGTFERYLQEICSYVSSGKLLDIGCATGELMQSAQGIGFDVYGVEISSYGIEMCKKKFGSEKILERPLSKNDFPQNFFDVITLSDVLEHIPDPRPFIEMLLFFLKKDGFLMIVTPDTSSIIRKIMKMKWLHYKEEHICYYRPSSITKLIHPQYNILKIKKAYKNLTIDYVINVCKGYSVGKSKYFFIFIQKYIPSFIRQIHFQIHIGEMFILLKKNNYSG